VAKGSEWSALLEGDRLRSLLAAKEEEMEDMSTVLKKKELKGERHVTGAAAIPTAPSSSPSPNRFVRHQTLGTPTNSTNDLVGENERLRTSLIELRQELAAKEAELERSSLSEVRRLRGEVQERDRELAEVHQTLAAQEKRQDSVMEGARSRRCRLRAEVAQLRGEVQERDQELAEGRWRLQEELEFSFWVLLLDRAAYV
jgi:hypothetical protein